ncbi:MAG: tyrosine recombinase [Cytophagales bacterium]|nr:tyrosine recombinase [Cytophagales bacterium]
MTVTCSELLDEFISEICYYRGLSPATQKCYRSALHNFYNWLAPRQTKLLDVSIDLMTAYINERAVNLKTATHNLQITILRQFYRWCIVEKHTTFDPTIRLIFAKQLPRNITPLSEHEIKRLLASLNVESRDGIRDRAMLEILYATGIRCSELIGLTLYSVLRKERAMLIIGKGRKERAVIFGESAGQWLDRYLAASRPQYWNAISSHQLFLQGGGRVMTAAIFRKAFKTMIQNAGITKPATPHTIRHSFATHMMNNGADIRVIQLLLGHEDITTTAIYTHIAKDYLKEVVRLHHPRGGDYEIQPRFQDAPEQKRLAF